MKPITGSIVALITPMLDDGGIDYPALRKLIDWHIEQGTDCIGVVGTTGESPTVTVPEQREIIRVSVEQAKGRVPIMAGCGANSTAEAIALARYAKEVGADCQLQVVPYYNKPTQEGIYQHFKAIAEAVDLPMCLYNVPGRAVADMQLETVNLNLELETELETENLELETENLEILFILFSEYAFYITHKCICQQISTGHIDNVIIERLLKIISKNVI